MIAADPKNAPSAEEVEIAIAGAIEQILALASTKADVEAERLYHPHHHLVQMLGVQAIALRFPLGQHGANELIYLVGLYCMVSMTLNGFNVPVPERE